MRDAKICSVRKKAHVPRYPRINHSPCDRTRELLSSFKRVTVLGAGRRKNKDDGKGTGKNPRSVSTRKHCQDDFTYESIIFKVLAA